ncbi:(2Fe-2S) ferredoxin domain-containing protein [Stigmatella sp. ncwal1]|uniref:(2Fe-2S) ferredoxin domain-containing protein n=1 Tax=Stigmatella ashevillensis TaxID=2995309 RepID=A0ABT5D4A9_9BACT|nr:(2Fe-2S) ferredoxin domain-containing protein [Stigmatella ashevillena]MDC0708507.1 (2Fe-2S) ferredoxin domain-containing protein [Stigmatella ashevillena]
MAPPFQRHVFVCTNRRPDGHPKGCCATKGGEEVRAAFKSEMEKRGIKGQMRANAAGCIDTCAMGVSVVVYPEGIWYGGVKTEDVSTIVEEHLLGGKPVERLMMPFMKKVPKPETGQ